MGDLFQPPSDADLQRSFSTDDLRVLLRKRYSMPEFCLMEEVRDAAGFKGRRSADAIAMAMWESRGLEVIGFEIKASRSDWLRERKDPEKAEAIATYCDRWFIVAAPGCVKSDELPEQWGLIEPRGKILQVIKAAPKREPRPLTRTFVAAMMRRCGELDERLRHQAIAEEKNKAREEAREDAARQIEQATRHHKELVDRLKTVKEQTGIDLERHRFSDEKVIAALKFALSAHDLAAGYGSLRTLQHQLRNLGDQIDRVLPVLPTEAEKTS